MLFIKFNYFYFISWDSNKKLCIFLITNKFFIFKWLIFKLLSYSNDINKNEELYGHKKMISYLKICHLYSMWIFNG